MNPEKEIRDLIHTSDVTIGSETGKRILSDALEHLEKFKQPSQTAVRRSVWSVVVKSPFGKLTAAAALVIAAVIGIQQITTPGIAWADVAERFQSVSFFCAAIYIKENALAEPRQFELWMGPEGCARMRAGSQVIFGRAGEVIDAFDIRKRQKVEPDLQAVGLLKTLGTTVEYSLETVIKSISGGKLVDVTPLVNGNAVVSEDVVVFDARSDEGLEWVRIYALRESRLPVGIRMWDPRDGECVDVLITYFKEPPDVFFDVQAFVTKLGDLNNSETDLAYMFLKDPGGQIITPSEALGRS